MIIMPMPASRAVAAVAAFRITTPVTETIEYVTGYEDAISFDVVSEDVTFDSVTIQQ